MNSKHFLLSKTVWFGAAQLVFGVVGLITGWMDSQTATALILTGFTTIGLRINTTQPITSSVQ